MKRLTLLLILAVLLGGASLTDAATCGTLRHPSYQPNCNCPPVVRRGTLLRRFKKKFRFRLKQECRKAAALGRQRCQKLGRRVTFRWRHLRSYARNVMGYKTGYCKIRFTCSIHRKKMSALRLSRSVSRAAGSSKVRRTTPAQIRATATQNGRQVCSRKYGRVVALRVTNTMCRANQCSVSWVCSFRKLRRAYWCQ